MIQHRELEMEKSLKAQDRTTADRLRADIRRQTTLSSTAAAKHRLWRSSRRRVGSRWAPCLPDVQELDCDDDSVEDIINPSTQEDAREFQAIAKVTTVE